jgi:hypothetical protein
MYSSFLRAIGVLSLVALGGSFGDEDWACAGAAVGFALHSVITIIAAGRVADFSVGDYLLGVSRPLLPCIPMFFAVRGAAEALAALEIPDAVSLVAQVVVGAIVYIGSAFVLLRKTVAEIVRLGRDALRKRRGR